ncbi:MAG: hypothetical protein ABJD07_09035 [Gemmatimonadaceae bacterium]
MTFRYLRLAAALTFGAATARVAAAQSASEHIALGDQLQAQMKPAEALVHYQAAVQADSMSYEALWKASRDAGDIAEFEADAAKRKELYRTAENYAQRAIAANATDAEGHFYLARALGKVALTLGKRDRVKYAGRVRDEAMAALKANPTHAGALHVMGRWNAEVMRLDGFSRFMAKNFLGGKVFNEASWDNAKRYLEQSVDVDPGRLTHHLDLGQIYADLGEKDKAKAQFEAVINGKETDYNDKFYKREATAALNKLS